MTAFDYIVLGIIACSVVVSCLRGLVKEILSLLSWVIGLVVANAYCDALATLLPDVVPGRPIRLIVAFLALFIGVKLLMLLLGMAIDALIEASGLRVVDRGLGSVFGLARGGVIVLAGVLLCGMTAVPQQAFWRDALLSPIAESAARHALPLLPGALSAQVRF